MPASINTPLWPHSKLSLTTPLSLLLTGASALLGISLYAKGYTYEGGAFLIMLSGAMFAWPYYSTRYTGYMTWLVMSCFVPVSIWAQNKAVEVGAWHYRPPTGYLLWITQTGEGWGHWTRHLWLGNDMPAMEYFFYPLFGLFQITLFSLFSHWLPDHWFERPHPKLRGLFPIVFAVMISAYVAIYFIFPNPNATDYMYWLAGVGYVVTLAGYAISQNYRDYSRSPAFWIWAVAMGVLFMPGWEFFHACFNRDWIYDRANTFPFFVTYRGAGIPLSELLAYLTSATTFHALMLLLILKFGHIVLKNPQLVPFSQKLRPPS